MADLRIGRVSNVDENNRAVRVRFESDNMTSGWLKVLQAPPDVSVTLTDSASNSDNSDDNTEDNGDYSEENGGSEKTGAAVEVKGWLPKIGDIVLCVYSEEWNSDGFVLGGL